MRKRFCTFAQEAGAGLLFLTASVSDMGAASVAQIALGLTAAATLLLLGTRGKLSSPGHAAAHGARRHKSISKISFCSWGG